MVGEIRDRETAEIAVQSALTGHLVLTTVHANNVYDVFGRFTHMGLDPYAMVSALNGVWAQRLLRINCTRCSAPCEPDGETAARLGLGGEELGAYRLFKGAGCGDCRGTGYRGRRAVAEVLKLDDEMRELIVERQPMRKIKEAARRAGTTSLLDAALALARAGHTTLEEVRRVALDS
jgi:general secretion pathway protein E